jgi:kanosamine 6-kinase
MVTVTRRTEPAAPFAGCCLGIDLGGTKAALRVSGGRAAVPDACFRWPEPGSLRADLAALDACLDEFLARCGQPIVSVAAAVPATVTGGRVVSWPNRPSWIGFGLREFLLGRFPSAVVRMADDGQAAALAEARQAGCQNLAYIGVGTGVGGGLVLSGKAYPRLSVGSELGHLVIDRRGPLCRCGRRGCVQALASGPATLARAARLRGSAVSAGELRDACARKDRWALAALADTSAALATAVVIVTELLGPRLIRIGGGFAHQITSLVPAVITAAVALDRPAHPHAPVQAAAFGAWSSLAGALLLATEQLPGSAAITRS